ncbi:MAG: SGNH/GDSL hydrolase family protein [Myxococcota bacterium]|nr:SGNH/GDSL hydrolase family protein [Myxococcota bacterium]
MSETPTRRPAPLAARVALLLGTTALLGLIFEVGVRVAKNEIAFQPDPDVIRSLVPNKERAVYTYETDDNLNGRSSELANPPALLGHCHTNNLGLRMQADIGPKAPDEKRILVFGDSYTEALETLEEDRFVQVAARHIEAAAGAAASAGENWRWTVVNAGIQNGTPSQYILLLRRFLPLIEPDIVVVVTGANDLTDDSNLERKHGFALDADGIPLAPENRWRLWWIQNSYFLRYVEVGARRLIPDLYEAAFPPANPDLVVPFWMDILCDEDPASRDQYPERTGRYLLAMKQLTESAGVEFAVLVMHYLYTFENEPYYEPRFPWLREKLEELGCYENYGAPFNQYIEAFLEENGVRYRNSQDAMAAAKREVPSRKLWNFYDYHFSRAGHQVMGDELYELIAPIMSEQAAQGPGAPRASAAPPTDS